MNYVYEICNYSFRCNVSDNFISEYFHYRFSGFVCEAEISSITDLKIIQRDNVNDILEKYCFKVDFDDFNFCDEFININVVDYKNYIIYLKQHDLIIICLNNYSQIIKKIIAIKLVSLVLSLLLQANVVCVHGACIKHNNKGLLLIGNSGSGKTSLSLKYIENGASITNDDATFIQCKENFYALKNTQFIGLTEDGILNEFSDYANLVSFIDSDNKKRIDLYRHSQLYFCKEVKITDIVLIDKDRGIVPCISYLSKIDMIKYIIKNISVYKYLYYDKYLQMIVNLVENSNSFILHPSNCLDDTFNHLFEKL